MHGASRHSPRGSRSQSASRPAARWVRPRRGRARGGGAPPAAALPEVERAPAPGPAETQPPAAAPSAEAAPQRASPAERPRILVLRANDADSYTQVAFALEVLLGDEFDLEQASLADSSGDPSGDSSGEDRADAWSAVIAIGAGAAEAVDTELDVPTVICQILERSPLLARRETLFAVEALPPLEMQLESWKRIAPGVATIGALMSPDQVELAAEARRAAAANGLELRIEFVKTDREALYRFRRLAASIDGFWLLPNREIFSPGVLRELLDYARGRGVHTIVFDTALLEWGGLLSVGSDTDDVAATVARVVRTLVARDDGGIERVTELTSVDVRLNRDVAEALGVVAPADVPRTGSLAPAFVR